MALDIIIGLAIGATIGYACVTQDKQKVREIKNVRWGGK